MPTARPLARWALVLLALSAPACALVLGAEELPEAVDAGPGGASIGRDDGIERRERVLVLQRVFLVERVLVFERARRRARRPRRARPRREPAPPPPSPTGASARGRATGGATRASA